MTVAISNGDVILIIVFAAIPVAAIAFIANAGNAFKSIGKGGLSVEFESDNPRAGLTDSGAGATEAAVNEAELRQMLEAKAYRQEARGETPLDVEEELAKALAEQRSPSAPTGEEPPAARGGPPARPRAKRAPRQAGQGAARGRGRGRAPAAGTGESRAVVFQS